MQKSLLHLSGIININIRATDRGNPPLHGDGFVQINVDSSAQQDFRFDNSTYTVYLREDSAKNDLVSTVAGLIVYGDRITKGC